MWFLTKIRWYKDYKFYVYEDLKLIKYIFIKNVIIYQFINKY